MTGSLPDSPRGSASLPWRQTAIALAAILTVLAGTFLPPPLHDHIAVWQAIWLVALFLASAWVPGYLLDEWLHLSGEQVTPASPAVWIALSCGLLAPAGWLVLALHTPLTMFGLLTAATILVLLAPHLIGRISPRPLVWPFGRQDRTWLFILGILTLTLLGLAVWGPENADNWTYNSYIREYIATNAVNAAHPSFGAGIPDSPRMIYNVWLVFQAFLSRGVGLHPGYAFAPPFKVWMALMALGAVYTLAAALFRTPARALRATAIFAALLFLAPGFREPGSQFITTINYDKYTALFVLMPAGMFLVLKALEGATWRDWAGLFVLGAGLSAVHAEVLMLQLLSCGFLLVTLLVLRHPFPRLRRAAGAIACLFPWSGFVAFTAWMALKRGPAPGSQAWELLHQADLAQGRIRFLGGSQWFIVEPTLVLYPLLVISLLLTPLLLSRRLRGRLPTALLLGNQIGPLVLMFLPGLPNLMDQFTEFNTLWRIGWICMPAFTIIYILDGFEDVWLPWWQRAWTGLRRILPAPLQYLLITLIGAVCLAGLVWTAVSALQREIIGWRARQWTPSPGLYETLAPLEPAVSAMGTPMVLASADETYQIPSIWPFARVLATRGIRGTLPSFPPERQEEALARLNLVNQWGSLDPISQEILDALQRFDVELIVLNREQMPALEDQFDRLPAMYWKLARSNTHSVYLVPGDPSSPLAVVGMAQAAWMRGDEEEACRLFDEAHSRLPDFATATAGAAWCAERAGRAGEALDLYQQALGQLDALPAMLLDAAPALRSWAISRPMTIRLLADAFLQDTHAFIAERLSRLSMPAHGTASGGALLWVGGWPRLAVQAPAGTLASLQLLSSVSSPVRLTLRAEGADGNAVFCSLLGGRSDGDLRVWTQHMLLAGEERLVELPALSDKRLWLQAQGTEAGSSCIAYGWYTTEGLGGPPPLSPEEECLAAWLSTALPGWEPGWAGKVAHALLRPKAGDPILATALAGRNLLQDADFALGEAGPWRRIAANPAAQFAFLPDEEGDLAAVVQGEGTVYQGGWCQTLAVTPRAKYLYLVRLSARLDAGGKVIAGYWDYRRLGQYRTQVAQMLKQSTDWTVVPAVIEVPAGVRSLSFCPALLSGPGEVRVDWAWLLPLDALQ